MQLSDNDVADMKLIAGTGTASWAQIGPGERAIHSVVVSTSASQLFNFTGAVVKYTASEESETQIVRCLRGPPSKKSKKKRKKNRGGGKRKKFRQSSTRQGIISGN